MVVSILRTKLYIPPLRPEVVARPRLLARLNAGLHQGRRLTVISAPAGFGKTTLLSAWVADCGEPAAWVSLDAGDNDPARFWMYLAEALRSLPDLQSAGVGESLLAALQSPNPPALQPLLAGLINEISAAPPQPGRRLRLLLFLDDYHVIKEPQIHDGLAFLLDHLPAQMHLVIATRADPPLPLSRLRARDQLTELNESDLRFTSAETTTFLNQVMALGLSAADIAALEARTEGWIVGLRMAGYALQSKLAALGDQTEQLSDYIAGFIGSHRYILDYLTDEVLTREPADVQDFLMQTAILERLSAPLCNAVAGQSDSQDMLERLDRANLFVIPLDDQRHWYRYHHLFAELLRQRLGRLRPEMPAQLHRRASAWYEQSHAIPDAITHALAGADYARAARLIEQHAIQQMMGHRKEATVAGWLEALPPEIIRQRPWLCAYQAWTRYWKGQREKVEECLLAAEAALAQTPAPEAGGLSRRDRQLIAGYIAAFRAHLALTLQDLPRVVALAEEALKLLPEGDFARCEAAVALGGAYWGQGNVLAAREAFAQGRATALKSGYPPLAVPSACYVGVQLIKQGRLHEAYADYRQALAWASGPDGARQPVAAFPLIRLGDLAREWNDLDAARRDLSDGVALSPQLGQADVLAEGQVLLARLQSALGDPAGAHASLDAVAQIARQTPIDPWIAAWADQCRLRLWLKEGQWAAANRWAEASGLRPDGELSYQHDLHHVNLARLLIARGLADPAGPDLAAGLGLLARLQPAAQRAGWVHEEIEILLLLAQGQYAAGQTPAALTALQRALALAEPGSYLRVFLDEGPALLRLLRLAAPRGLAPAQVGWILAAGDAAPADVAPADQTALFEALSEREIEVLRLIADGLSNNEIGERLFIAPGTVKAHTSAIYAKLDARGRTAAVARARALGLL